MKGFWQLVVVLLVSSILLVIGGVMVTCTFIYEWSKVALVVIETRVDVYMETMAENLLKELKQYKED